MPKISIIIPCYNHGKYLNEAVDSVLDQTYQDFEIIIVNDGSTDEFTKHLLSNYKKEKTNIIHTHNQGLPSARNHGIRHAKGEYILPLDADDIIDSHYLNEAIKVLDNNEKIGIVYSLAKFFGKKSGTWELPEFSMREMLLRNIIFCSAFFRKSDWEKVGGYNPNMKYGWEDWDLWLSILELGRGVHRIQKHFFNYRIKNNSMIYKMTEYQKSKMRFQIFNNHIELYKNNLYDFFQYIDFDNTRKSWSYKIGRMITKPLSKLINFKNSL